MLASPTAVLVLVLGVLASLGGLLGGVYAYGEHRYHAGESDQAVAQKAATDALNAQIKVWTDAQAAALEAAEAQRQAQAGQAVAGAGGTGCDYTPAQRAALNAITIGKPR